jgi:hypothetical protein
MVSLWNQADQDSSDTFRGLYITHNEVNQLIQRSLGENWGSSYRVTPEDEEKYTAVTNELAEKADLVIKSGFTPRLISLARNFQLSVFEYNAFLICLAPALDLRYEKVYGFLQNDVTRKIAGASLILDLLVPDGSDRLSYLEYFQPEANLLRYGLIYHPENEAGKPPSVLKTDFIVAPEIVSWILDAYRPADELNDFIQLSESVILPPAQWIPSEILSIDLQSLRQEHPILSFYGLDDQLQRISALYLAGKLSGHFLEIDLAGLKSAQLLDVSHLQLCLRDALLTDAIPYFIGWDSILNEDGFAQNRLLAPILGYQNIIMTSGEREWRIPLTVHASGKPMFSWLFTQPTASQRRQLWNEYLGDEDFITPADLELLSGQFVLTSAQIKSAVYSARNGALQKGGHITLEDLFEAARMSSTHQLDQLAVKIQPRYSWKDIVLPDDEMSVLHEIASTVRDRVLVLETWGLGKKLVSSTGISALFAGEPGTGKTLSAQVIASELGMDLYKMDLSTIVSKYVGETEKNLEHIFTQARNSNAILFFDEADAIFGKRSEVKDAHDRYANIEVGYLLQRMESYDGIVILATNLRSNMDEAFTRRLQFVVDFPFPDENQRLEIWKVLFPADVPRDEDIDFQVMAGRFKLAGGSIRNIIVSASFLAASEGRSVSMRHLLHGVRREMKKMGRLIDEKDLVIV